MSWSIERLGKVASNRPNLLDIRAGVNYFSAIARPVIVGKAAAGSGLDARRNLAPDTF